MMATGTYLDSLMMGGGAPGLDQMLAEMEAMAQEQQGDVIGDALSGGEDVARWSPAPGESPEGDEAGGLRGSDPYRTPQTPSRPGSPDAMAGSMAAMPAAGAAAPPSESTPTMPDAPSPVSAEPQAPAFSSQLRVGGAGGGSSLGGVAGGLLGGGLQAGGPDMGEDDPSSLLASLMALLGGQGGGEQEF